MDCCIGESPLLEDSLDDATPGGLEAEDDEELDNWQLLVVFVQDVCPLVAKVRGGLGGIGSTCNNTLYYLAKNGNISSSFLLFLLFRTKL